MFLVVYVRVGVVMYKNEAIARFTALPTVGCIIAVAGEVARIDVASVSFVMRIAKKRTSLLMRDLFIAQNMPLEVSTMKLASAVATMPKIVSENIDSVSVNPLFLQKNL